MHQLLQRVRSARRDGMDGIKKVKSAGGVTEDDGERYEGEIQKLTDVWVKKIEDTLGAKEAEILKV